MTQVDHRYASTRQGLFLELINKQNHRTYEVCRDTSRRHSRLADYAEHELSEETMAFFRGRTSGQATLGYECATPSVRQEWNTPQCQVKRFRGRERERERDRESERETEGQRETRGLEPLSVWITESAMQDDTGIVNTRSLQLKCLA